MSSHFVSVHAPGHQTAPALFSASAHPSAREFERSLLDRGARPNSCVYVSTPITTGPLTLGHNPKTTPTRTLVDENIRHAREVVARTAAKVKAVVIDPTDFEDVEGWEQPDYHAFWLDIIETYVAEVAFCNGWEYSTGCCIEFLRTLELGLPRFDETLRPLHNSEALRLLTVAIRRMEAANLKTASQRQAAKALVAQIGSRGSAEPPSEDK